MSTTPPTPTLVLAWGLPVPTEAIIAWGARAIYKLVNEAAEYASPRRVNGRLERKLLHRAKTVASIDILYDRQDAASIPDADIDDRLAFERWINKSAIPALRRLCVKDYVTGDSDQVIDISEGCYRMQASPRASYGYLYIVAWKV